MASETNIGNKAGGNQSAWKTNKNLERRRKEKHGKTLWNWQKTRTPGPRLSIQIYFKQNTLGRKAVVICIILLLLFLSRMSENFVIKFCVNINNSSEYIL